MEATKKLAVPLGDSSRNNENGIAKSG